MQTTLAPDLGALVRPSGAIYEDPKRGAPDFPAWAEDLRARLLRAAEPVSDYNTMGEIEDASLQELLALVEEWQDLPPRGVFAVRRADAEIDQAVRRAR